MNWLHYLLEANIYLGVFYAAYCLFLTKETHYLLNRVYLVFTCIISFILPVLQLGILIPPLSPVVPATFEAVPVTPATDMVSAPAITEQHFYLQDGLWYIYLAGAAVLLILFIIKLCSLFKLVIGKPVLKHTHYNLIYINDSQTAFSFFNYLFIGKNMPDEKIITRHELVHIRQRHSADIVFLEVLKIINWFNPLIYLVQNSLKTVHEYIADEQSVDNADDALAYSSFLVNNAYGLTGPSITHSFFTYNLLKKRIIMLNQQRSGNLARLKYFVAVPIGAGLLCASTLGFSKTYGWIDIAPRKASSEPEVNKLMPVVATPTYDLNDVKNVLSPPVAPVQHKTDIVKFPPPIVNGKFKPEKTYVNTKGYTIEEGHYTPAVNGDTYYVVLIKDKTGHTKAAAYKSHNKQNERYIYQKYGYKFPDVKVSYPASSVQPKPYADQVKFPPPIVKPNQSASSKPKTDIVRFPPPSVLRDGATDIIGKKFSGYFFLNFRYPEDAYKNNISGNIIVQFNIDSNHNLTSPTIVSGINNSCDKEVIRVLNNYKYKLPGNKGTYKIGITMYLDNGKTRMVPTFPNSIMSDPDFLGQIVVTPYNIKH